jgi:hypothetical protein
MKENIPVSGLRLVKCFKIPLSNLKKPLFNQQAVRSAGSANQEAVRTTDQINQ